MKRYVISVLVDNHSGVLSRVAGLFSRRGFNIDSISVGETQDPTVSRMTIVTQVDDAILEQIIKQLGKLVDVLKVAILPAETSVYRELVLIKVKADDRTRATISDIIDVFRAKIVDIAPRSMTVEITGDQPKIKALLDLLEPYGILEVARAGLVGMHRGDHNILTQEDA